MGKEWKEVARLGGTGAWYPHVLVDTNGWCLRLGPARKGRDKYYASLPILLRGLVEHMTRRRLLGLSGILDLEGLIAEVEDALHSALSLSSEVLERGGMEMHIRRLERSKSPGMGRKPSRAS
jgi:hypothetical protein